MRTLNAEPAPGGGTPRALRHCPLAPGPADQATWLKLAAEWLVLKQRQPRTASDRLQIGKREAALGHDEI